MGQTLFPRNGITLCRFAVGKQSLILKLRDRIRAGDSYGKPVTGQVFELSGRQAAEIGIDGLDNTSRIPESLVLDHQTQHGYRSASHRSAMMGRL